MSSRPARGAARLAAILDALPDALLLVSGNGIVVNANTIAREILESQGAALVGTGLFELLPEFDRRQLPGEARPEGAEQQERTRPTRMTARRADGTAFPVEVTSSRLTAGQSPYASAIEASFVEDHDSDELLLLVVRDLSGTLDTEAELSRQQRQTETILRAATEGVIGVDSDGRVVLANPAAAQLLGHRAGQLGGQDLHPLILHSHADGSPLSREETPLHDTLTAGRRNRVGKQVLWTKNGQPVPVELTTAPVREGEQLVGAVLTFTDRRAQDALSARHEQLGAVLAEGLRGPLEQLSGELSALAADPAGQLWPEANQVLHHLSAGYARMTTLIDNVLSFQRLDAGVESLDRRLTAIDAVIHRGVEGATELIGPGRAQFAVHAPQVEAEVDAERLAQALAHLVADVAGVDATGRASSDAQPAGDSTIVVAAAERGDVVRIEVRGPYTGGDPVHAPLVRGMVRLHGGVLQTHEVPGAAGGRAYVLEVPVRAERVPVMVPPRQEPVGETTVVPLPNEPVRGTTSQPDATLAMSGGPGAADPSARQPVAATPQVAASQAAASSDATALAPAEARSPAPATPAVGVSPAGAAPLPAVTGPTPPPAESVQDSATPVPNPAAPAPDRAESVPEVPAPEAAKPAASAPAAPPLPPSDAAPPGGGAAPSTSQQLPAAPAPVPDTPTGRRRRSLPDEAAVVDWQGAPQPAVSWHGDNVSDGSDDPTGGGRRRRALAAPQGAAEESDEQLAETPAGGLGQRERPVGPEQPSPPGYWRLGAPPAPSAPPDGDAKGEGAENDEEVDLTPPPPDPATALPSRRPQHQAAQSPAAPVPPAPQPPSAPQPPAPQVAAPQQPGPASPPHPTGAPTAGALAAGGADRDGEPAVASEGAAAVSEAAAVPGADTAPEVDDAGSVPDAPAARQGEHTVVAASPILRSGSWPSPQEQQPRPAQPPLPMPGSARTADPMASGVHVQTLGQGIPVAQLTQLTDAHDAAAAQAAGQLGEQTGPQTPAGGQSMMLPGSTSGPRRKLASPPSAEPPPTTEGTTEPVAPSSEGRRFTIGAPAAGSAEGPEPLDGPNGAVEVTDGAGPVGPVQADDELPPEPLDNPRRLLVWPEPDAATQQALTDRGYRPVLVQSRQEVDAQGASSPAALFVDPLTGPITRTALQSLRQAAGTAGVPVLVTAGLGQASRDAAYGADPAVLLKALAPRDSEQHPPRVLLVEERQPIADALAVALERRGMQVAKAASDSEAMEMGTAFRPNLVVMDLGQVRRRRASIVDWLRVNGLLSQTPFVVYTAADLDQVGLPQLTSGETVLFLAERSTQPEVQDRIVDLLAKIGVQ